MKLLLCKSVLLFNALGAGVTLYAMDITEALVPRKKDRPLTQILSEKISSIPLSIVKSGVPQYAYAYAFKPSQVIEIEGNRGVFGVSPDEKTIATGTKDGSLIFFDRDTGEETERLKQQSGPIVAVAFDRDGSRVTSVSDQSVVAVSGLDKESRVAKIRTTTRGLGLGVISQDGKVSLTSSKDELRFAYPEENTTWAIPLQYPIDIASIAIGPDYNALVGGGDGVVIFVDVERNEKSKQKELRGQKGIINVVALSPDGQTALAAGSLTNTATLWDVKKGTKLYDLVGHTSPIISAAFSPDNQFVLTGSRNGKVILSDSKTGQFINDFTVQGKLVSVGFSPNGSFIAINTDENLFIYE